MTNRCLHILRDPHLSHLTSAGAVCSHPSGEISLRQSINYRTPLTNRPPAGVSFIEQPPCTGSDLAILAWFLKPADGRLKKHGPMFSGWGNRLTVEGSHFTLEILANDAVGGGFQSDQQTTEVFSRLDRTLSENRWSLLGNTVRTWVYVRDIDNQYQGMTVARKAFFTGRGLTEKTRFIASTGIEARSREANELVSLDALSIGGLQAHQIQRMEALQNLCPASSYGVTFERGTRVRFGDRSHLWISGTASIDETGQVLFPTDVVAQTRRTLDDIEALLDPQGATLRNLGHLVVYLRNRNHVTDVISVLRERILNPCPGSWCKPLFADPPGSWKSKGWRWSVIKPLFSRFFKASQVGRTRVSPCCTNCFKCRMASSRSSLTGKVRTIRSTISRSATFLIVGA